MRKVGRASKLRQSRMPNCSVSLEHMHRVKLSCNPKLTTSPEAVLFIQDIAD